MFIRRVFFSSSIWLVFFLSSASSTSAQSQSSDLAGIRGNRPQVAITIKEGSSQLIGPLVTVKVYYRGTLQGQITTSKGRAVFILNGLGDFVVTADAAGYRSAQREIYVPVAVDTEEDIVLQRNSVPEASGSAGRPLLAPKAREALEKAVQALGHDNVGEADKDIGEAARLAPNHPDVLYVQGVIFLKRSNWAKAQESLFKATQIDPSMAKAYTALGMALVNDAKYEESMAPLEHALQLNQGDWEAQWTLGKAYYHQEQYDSALKMSQQAMSESKGAAPAIALLVAQCQTAVGNFEGSAETLRAFLREHPKDPDSATARKWLDRLAADGKLRKN